MGAVTNCERAAAPERMARRQGNASIWMEWGPLVALPAAACAFAGRMAAWEFMWALAAAIFLGCKWETWFAAREERAEAPAWRSLAYLLLWPGMDARAFLATGGREVARPGARKWAVAAVKTLIGAAIMMLIVQRPEAANGLATGWVGMLGLVVLLHFGIFELMALAWQQAGVDARPIMRSPLAARSLSEFWGKRWNMGFRQLSHRLVYEPVRRWTGRPVAVMAAFLTSGVIHDVVISVPARAGYGLPTAYFLLQGAGVLLERSSIGRRLGIQGGWRGWAFGVACVGLPTYGLFHPAFVRNVMLPFFAAMGRAMR
ncbi:MAG TPA: membrane bound O-acyl transferase family-domain-containing protein [Candidatus Acidoferrales bacterium]|nr:membrane bound O-acyl transferase family-domain-containing protein [Candidatus Acidoferrales bacterium]